MSIQKGIIEKLIDNYSVKVRVPKYHKIATDVNGIKTENLADSIICSQPGMQVTYSVGDVVLVDFENNELSKPVVLGLLYKANGSNAILEIPEIKDKLTLLDDQLNKLNSSGMYTHIRYSNDNGKTFTSLFEYTNVLDTVNEKGKVLTASYISANTQSTTVYWSIINKDNVNITHSFKIETKVYTKEDKSDMFISDKALFEIPINYRHKEHLYIDFEILNTNDLSDCYVSLTTDKDELGCTYGDYIGVCVDNKAIAPSNITEYTWTSLMPRTKKLVSEMNSGLESRVAKNEHTLYGYSKPNKNSISDGTGLLDAFTVNLDNIVVSKNKSKIQFGVETNYVDLTTGTSHQNTSSYNDEFIFKILDNGHFRLVGKEKL